MGQPPVRILFDDVGIAVDGRPVVRHLTWRIRPRQSWLMTGPSGCGKSLLAEALCGRTRLASGRVLYFSPDGTRSTPFPDESTLPRRAIVCAGTQDQRRGLGPDSFYQARWNSVGSAEAQTVETALSPAALFAVSPFQVLGPTDVPADFSRRRSTAIQRLRLEPLLTRTVAQLSSGERRRLLLAQALARAPQVLVLDDPFDGLDPVFRDHLREVLAETVATGDLQLVLITPRPDEAVGMALSHLRLQGDGGWAVSGRRVEAGRPRPPPVVVAALPPRGPCRRRHGNAIASLPDPLICLRDITVRYGDSLILDRVSWQARPGENWLITGPNGSGKTTLLGLLTRDNPQAYAQDVTVLGRRADAGTPMDLWRQPLGFASPELLLAYPPETSCRNVILSGFADSVGLYHAPSPAQQRAAAVMLRRLGLERVAEVPLGGAPEGAQRLALLGRALVKSPRLLLLDEPCQGLDRGQRRLVRDRVDGAAADGVHVVYVSHHVEDRPACITHALHLEAGRIARCGSLAR